MKVKKSIPQKIQASKKQTGSSAYKLVQVFMPRGPNDLEVLKDLIKHCETIKICFTGTAVTLGLAPNKADEIVKKLSALSYDGQKLSINSLYNRPIDPLLKRISLAKNKYEEKLKVHFSANKVQCLNKNKRHGLWLYILHFSTKQAADEAMKRSIELNGREIYPLDCFFQNKGKKRNVTAKGPAAKKMKTNEKMEEENDDDDEENVDDDDEEDDDDDDGEEDNDDDDGEEDNDDDDDDEEDEDDDDSD